MLLPFHFPVGFRVSLDPWIRFLLGPRHLVLRRRRAQPHLEPLESRLAPVAGVGTGLVGNYYADPNLTNLVYTATDAVVDFDWQDGTAAVAVPADRFSVRWTGQVQAQVSEPYTFYTQSDDGVRLRVNGQLLIDNWTDHALTENSGTIALTAGEVYDLVLEYFDNTGAATARLLWSSPSTPRAVIPTTQLYADAGWVSGGWREAAVGGPAQAGSVRSAGNVYTVAGSGQGFVNNWDQFHFVHRTLQGDGEVVARLTGMDGTATGARAGVLVRESFTGGGVEAGVLRRPDGAVEFVYRGGGGGALSLGGSAAAPATPWVKLVRSGNLFTGYVSATGSDDSWQWVGTASVPMSRTVHAGLAVTSGDAGQVRSATFEAVRVTSAVPLGAGIDSLRDWTLGNAFVDMTRQARDFVTPDFTAPVAVDTNGWPTTDFATILQSGFASTAHLYNGTYHLSFTGQASLDLWVTPGELHDQVYDPATNTTTATLVLAAPEASDWYLGLIFRNTAGGVRNLRLIRPGYAADTTQVFTNEYLAHLRSFSTLRMMDFTSTNENTVAGWAERTRPESARQSTERGVAWEYAVQLANLLDKDLWINVPYHATDDYVIQLATLLRDSLEPDRAVYVEFSNELWNWQFRQTGENFNAARAEVAAGGSPLNADGETNEVYWSWRRVAKRTKEIGDLFRGIWGEAAMLSRVRPVLATQIANPEVLRQGLEFLERTYGDPARFLYGVAGAPYFNLNGQDSRTDLSADDVLAALQASLANVPALYAQFTALAARHGLRTLAYEGGPDTFGPNNIAAKRAASLDPRMRDLVVRYLTDWYGHGGDLFNWFIAGPTNWNTQYGTWGLTYALDVLSTPKTEGLAAVLAAPRPALTGGTPVPGTVEARAHLQATPPYTEPYLRYLHPGQYVEYLVRAPRAGLYRLTLVGATPGDQEQVGIMVNSVPVGTVTLSTTGGYETWGDTAAGNVYLSAGLNVLRLTSVTEVVGWNLQTLVLGPADATALPPAAPSGLAATAVAADRVELTWTDHADNETAYLVERATDASFGSSTLTAVAANTTHFVATDLAASTTYYFRVRASNAVGESAYSNSVAVTTAAAVSRLLVQDSFPGSAGPLHRATGGSGWDAAGWVVQNDDTNTPGYEVTTAAPLAFGTLQTSGGHATGGRAWQLAGRGLDMAGALADYQQPNTSQVGRDGTTLWLSLLLRRDTAVGSGQQPTRVSLHPNDIVWYDGGRSIAVGYLGAASDAGGNGYWSLEVGGTVARSPVAVRPGEAALLVLRLDFGAATDTATLYVNPSTLGGTPPATFDARLTAPGIAFRSLAYYGGDSSGVSALDEIRLGDTFAAVTPTATAPPAAPVLVTSAAANPSPVAGTSTALSVRATDDGGAANLTYTWSVTSQPPGVPAPTFSRNGDNAAQDTMATFAGVGSYTFTVRVSDGALSTTSSVTVEVRPTVTTVTVAPATVVMVAGSTLQFSATAHDQFGAPLAAAPAFTWQATGGGTISASGLFTAPAVAAVVQVAAQSGTVTGTAAVTVVAPPAAPTHLVGWVVSGRRVRLAWQDQAANEHGFQVEASRDGVTWTRLLQVGPVAGSGGQGGALTGPLSRGRWYFRVQAFNDVGLSGPSNTISVVV